jgi:hypothetical protein
MTQHHIPEHLNHQQHHHENLKILYKEEEAITDVEALIETGDKHCAKTKGHDVYSCLSVYKGITYIVLGILT